MQAGSELSGGLGAGIYFELESILKAARTPNEVAQIAQTR